MLDPEIARYIEHLQRQLMDERASEYFDLSREKEWIASRPPALQRLLDRHGDHRHALMQEYERRASEFESPFKYESFHSTSVFLEVLRKVQESCAALNVSPKRPVILAPNTALGVSPLARPSAGEHLLFSGVGTMAFCNYWAKAYAGLLYDFSQSSLPLALDRADLPMLASSFPEHIILLSRLLLYYGHFGTLLGFGEVSVDERHEGLRLEILEAMEVFAIAHEIGHFVAEEMSPSSETSMSPDEAYSLEFFCDQYGQAVARWYGAENSKWLCFNATGAILYLHSADLSMKVARALVEGPDVEHESRTHPRTTDRIVRLVSEAVACVPDDQKEGVRSYLGEILAVTQFVEKEIASLVLRCTDSTQGSG